MINYTFGIFLVEWRISFPFQCPIVNRSRTFVLFIIKPVFKKKKTPWLLVFLLAYLIFDNVPFCDITFDYHLPIYRCNFPSCLQRDRSQVGFMEGLWQINNELERFFLKPLWSQIPSKGFSHHIAPFVVLAVWRCYSNFSR